MGVWHGLCEMTEQELRRAEVLSAVKAGRLTMTAAAMGATRRQALRPDQRSQEQTRL